MNGQSTRTVTLANGERIQLRQWHAGRYRLTLSDDEFGQIKRHGRDWEAQIRFTGGSIKRYAGIWSSLREAVAELVDYKNGELGPYPMRLSEKSAHHATKLRGLTMNDTTQITLSYPENALDDVETDWGSFKADNSDDPEILASIERQIAEHNYAEIGGGAAPLVWIFA